MPDPIVEIRSGDRLRGLAALRDVLASRLSDCPSRELPAVVRRLEGLMAEIDRLASPGSPSKAEELKQRRAQRLRDAFAADGDGGEG